MAAASTNPWKRSPSIESTSSSSSNPWNRSTSIESMSSSLHQITKRLGETSLTNGCSGGDSKVGKGWGKLFESATSSANSDDIVLRGQHVRSSRSGDGDKADGSSDSSREQMRMSVVGRNKNFKHMERVNGRLINVMEGLELHTGVFNADEQRKIVNCVYEFQEKGRKGQLRERTYSEPRKWMRGKGRITIQFGCCYNYATDKNGNPPGIIRDEEVDPIPPLLKMMIKRMVSWHVLPPTCIPNSCIVNIYDKDDCIPPHIDHHDFVRPFCTVSFLAECNILFGTELRVLGPGEFSGAATIPLPLGSVLVLKGNGADVAKHCVPAVPAKRISITFRKMDDSKLPFEFIPDPELQNLRPLQYPPNGSPSSVQSVGSRPSVSPAHLSSRNSVRSNNKSEETREESSGRFKLGQDDFPALGSNSVNSRIRKPGRSLRQ